MIPHFGLLIRGASRATNDGGSFSILSPHDGRIIATVSKATTADLDEAVLAAQEGFRLWSSQTAYAREATIRKATAHVRTLAEDIGRWMALEQGKPLAQCVSEVKGSCDTLDYYASEAPRIEGYSNPTEDNAYRSWVVHQPVGVCGLITPWNYPLSLLSWKLGPALATGCTVVVKPTTVTPISPLAFCLGLIAGGLPPGAVQCLPGPGSNLGDAMVRHPGIAKIAMTGSSDVGKRILAAAAPFLKKVSLELGGQCPAIVCADADVNQAATVIAYKGFRNCGQSCSSVNRVYAHASIHDALVEKLRELASKLTMGDGLSDPKVDLGPMATLEGVTTAEQHVTDALSKGASLECGGARPTGAQFAKGNYYLPTVLTNCDHSMQVMREETFAAVVPIAKFASVDEAIALANDTPYGLVAYLFTKDFSTTVRMSESLEAGTVCVNHGAVNTNYGPYAGWKDSGYGLELSRRAVFEYLKPKHIKVLV